MCVVIECEGASQWLRAPSGYHGCGLGPGYTPVESTQSTTEHTEHHAEHT